MYKPAQPFNVPDVHEITADEYNTILHKFNPLQISAVAIPADICAVCGTLCCICQTKNGANNIAIFTISQKQNIMSARWAFSFLLYLKHKYNIEYVQIHGTKNRYKLLRKLFPTLREKATEKEDSFFLHIDKKTELILWELAKNTSTIQNSKNNRKTI